MKTCIKCNKEKQSSDFHKDKLRSDGLFPYCKSCRSKPKKKRKTRSIDEVLSNYTVSQSGCWEWNGVINSDGYGIACYQGKQVRAHRLSLLIHLGLNDSDLLALHNCDNRSCINPDHLYLGTNQDNSNDMANRDRTNPLIGEESALSKITEEQAVSILKDSRPHQEIAEDYSVSKSTISSIKTGRRWKHIRSNGLGKSYKKCAHVLISASEIFPSSNYMCLIAPVRFTVAPKSPISLEILTDTLFPEISEFSDKVNPAGVNN